MKFDDKAAIQAIDHHPKPTPNAPDTTPVMIKEVIQSVENLSKSIREFPKELGKETHATEIAGGTGAIVGLVVGLLFAKVFVKGK